MYGANTYQKKLELGILISDKADFRRKAIQA